MDNSTAGKQFDINPPNTYGNGSSVEDVIKGGVNNILFSGNSATAPTDDLCTERWYLSESAITCVEIKATVMRKRNTGDTAHDINLTYSSVYNMHAAVGRVADSSDQALQFATQAVDFS